MCVCVGGGSLVTQTGNRGNSGKCRGKSSCKECGVTTMLKEEIEG